MKIDSITLKLFTFLIGGATCPIDLHEVRVSPDSWCLFRIHLIILYTFSSFQICKKNPLRMSKINGTQEVDEILSM